MSQGSSVWVVDDDASIRWVLEKALSNAGFAVTLFNNADDVLKRVRREQPDVIVTDIRMPGTSGLEMLEALGRDAPDLPVIVMTAHSDLDSAVSAYQGGAFEYLPKPFDLEEAVALVGRALQKKALEDTGPKVAKRDSEIIGEAPAMQTVFRVIGRLSGSQMNVLISGESGTGKELVARAIYRNSLRSAKPFVAINTAAIPAELLESELFGHEKGAFTGAQEQRRGRFEQASGGTLFLDEIGDMSASAQAKVLRALQENVIQRVGSEKDIKVDCRVIAATNKDLRKEINEGNFREDLFHRLAVILIHVPALNDRTEDIPLLANHFIKMICADQGVPTKSFDKSALDELQSINWTGNIRELRNVIERLVILCGPMISSDDVKLYSNSNK